ncbi:MAG TPA: N-acetylmuramoyl-L-alanine amidase [Solirubrobacteraceae bacterium]|nr:N-acetylmuramoyl-L-alanine amidase [Solirubrobacteraceae bacterium]
MTVAGEASAPVLSRWIGRLSGVAPPVAGPEPFVLAGIDWRGPTHAAIDLRARLGDGRWTPWVRASVLGHDSDRGETVAHALVGEPIWTGSADAVQLRCAGGAEGVTVHLVSARAVLTLGDRAAAASFAPSSTTARPAAALPLAGPRLSAGPGPPPIIARQAWAAGLPPRAAPSYGDVRMAFVHHSVNANGYAPGEVPAILRAIYAFHTYTRGWNDIGYNFAVDASGRLWEARAGGIDRPVIGAHAGGYNAESFGVVLLGDFATVLPTDAARAALARLIAWKLALHGQPVTGRVTVEVDPPDAFYTPFRPGQHVFLPRVAGHRDGCRTDCPGQAMYRQGMPPLRRAVAGLAGRTLALTLRAGEREGRPVPYGIAPGPRVRAATYLDLQAVTTLPGEPLPLDGRLCTLAGAPIPGARILLQSLTSTRAAQPVTTLSAAVTGADGRFATVLHPAGNLLLRALHARPPAVVSALLLAGVRPLLTFGAILLDGTVQATGTVNPARAEVVLEVRPAGRLGPIHPRRILVTAEGGVFAAELRLPPGRYTIRAVVQADAATLAGESPPVTLEL